MESLGVHGNIILEWMLKKLDRRLWSEFIWLRTGTSGGLLGSIKGAKFLDWLSDY